MSEAFVVQAGEQSEAPAIRDLSDWQLARVRNALRGYHRYGRDSDGAYFTWKDVREAIAEYTDTEIGANAKLGAERLRQFVEGITDERIGTRRFPVPQPDALGAIIAFLTHEEIALLTPEELREHAPGPQAVLRLAEFLAEGCDMYTRVVGHEICGNLRALHGEEPGVLTITALTLQQPLEDAATVLQVIEERSRYDCDDAEEAWRRYMKMDRGAPLSRSAFAGWCVLTPQDTMMMFLKDGDTGRNHSYFAVSDIGVWNKSGRKHLYLMKHEYGFEIGQFAPAPGELEKDLAAQVLSFDFLGTVRTTGRS